MQSLDAVVAGRHRARRERGDGRADRRRVGSRPLDKARVRRASVLLDTSQLPSVRRARVGRAAGKVDVIKKRSRRKHFLMIQHAVREMAQEEWHGHEDERRANDARAVTYKCRVDLTSAVSNLRYHPGRPCHAFTKYTEERWR
jgi:hypothetical protein